MEHGSRIPAVRVLITKNITLRPCLEEACILLISKPSEFIIEKHGYFYEKILIEIT